MKKKIVKKCADNYLSGCLVRRQRLDTVEESLIHLVEKGLQRVPFA